MIHERLAGGMASNVFMIFRIDDAEGALLYAMISLGEVWNGGVKQCTDLLWSEAGRWIAEGLVSQ